MVTILSHGSEGSPGIQFPGWFWVPGTHLEIELDSPFHLSQAPKLWALLTMHDVLSRSR